MRWENNCDFTSQSRRWERPCQWRWPWRAWPGGRPDWDWGRDGTRRRRSGPAVGMPQSSPEREEVHVNGFKYTSTIQYQTIGRALPHTSDKMTMGWSFFGSILGLNGPLVVNELDCGHRHKNHSVSVTQETQPEWTDSSMKPHDWGNTAVIHLIGVFTWSKENPRYWLTGSISREPVVFTGEHAGSAILPWFSRND